VAEGVDFDRHYGRAVLLLGVPFQYTLGRVLRARLEFLRDTCAIDEAEFLTFDAIRNAAQCAGRVIRGKTDYGIVIFADKRYNRADKRDKLPGWIKQFITDASLNLSSDLAMHKARAFLREMAQPTNPNDTVALDHAQLTRHPSYVASAAGPAAITSHPLQSADANATLAAQQQASERARAAAGEGAAVEVEDVAMDDAEPMEIAM